MKLVFAILLLAAVAYANVVPPKVLAKLGPLVAKTGPREHRNAGVFALHKLAHSLKHLKQAKATAANMNAFIDHFFADVDQWIIENGWEPYPVPDIHQEFTTGDFIPISGDLYLTNGELYGMSNMHRKGDCMLYYGNKLMTVHLPLSFYDLQLFADYEVDVIINPSGQIFAEIFDLEIMVDLTIDFQNYEIMMNTFEFTNAGSINIEFHGEVLVDWLLNLLSDLLTWVLHDTVLGLVEGMMVPTIEELIVTINAALKDLLAGNFQPEKFLQYVH